MQRKLQKITKSANNACNTLCVFSVIIGAYMNGTQTMLNRMFTWFSRLFAFVATLAGTAYATEYYKLAENRGGSLFKSFIEKLDQNGSSNLFEFPKFGFIKTKCVFLMGFTICLMLLFAWIAVADAVEPPTRYIYVNDWGGITDSEEKLKGIIDDAEYMNCDAVLLVVWSNYFEAVRDPINKADWDRRAGWDMVGTGIQYAHSKNMQFHVWVPINYVNSDLRAERRFFGDQYCVIYRNGYVQRARNDLAFKEIYDYEIDLMGFIAGHYPDLDGIQIEEPLYPYTQSYSTAMRDRVQAKYGYDPLDMGEVEMIPIINEEMTCVMNEFFTELRTVTKAANPNLQLSANGLHYYSAHTGFAPHYMSRHGLLDWYAAQIYRDNLADYKSAVEIFNGYVTEIPIAAIAGISYINVRPSTNDEFLAQIENTHEFGADTAGIFTYHYRDYVVDGGVTAMDGLHTIEPTPTPSHAPVFNTIDEKSINEGFLLEFTISATDPDGDSLTYSAENPPSGATFDPAARVFSWTPNYGQAGAYSVRFVVNDGHLTDTEDIMVLVNSMTPQYIGIEAEAVDEITTVMEVVSDPSASGGSYVGAPEGTDFSAPGHTKHTIIIQAQGNYKVCGLVHAPDTNSNSFFVQVDDGPDMTWAIPVTDGWVWDEVNHWGSGTETNPEIDPVIFSLSAGEHVLTVKHREAGTKLDRLLITNDLTYVPHDTIPPVADAGTDWTVDPDTMVYFDGSRSTDDVGIESYSWDFDASDGIQSDATGVTASHIYTEPGSYIVTLTVTDTSDNTDTDTCMVTVDATHNSAPILDTISNKSINEGYLLKFTISASDPDGNSLSYSAGNLPSGATFDSATHTFSWTPDHGQEGVYSVHFEVTDGYLTDTKDITITVSSAATVYIRLEAEDADEICSLMEIASDDPLAYNGSYVWVPDGGGWNAGYVRYILTITTPGDYKICGRVQAPTDANNSFLVRIDDDPDRTWSIPVTGKWEWDEVNHWDDDVETAPEIDPVIFTLSTGMHVLTIKHRESGTKLDRLLITNDINFVPHVQDTTPPVADAGQDQTVCKAALVYFDGSRSTDDVGIGGYSWDFDDSDGIQSDATGVTASHIYTESGSYVVTLTITDIFGNTDNDTCMVTVDATIKQMASHFGVTDTSGASGTYTLVPVKIANVTNGPIQTIRFNILYNESVLNLNSKDSGYLQPGTLTDAGWWFMLGSNNHTIILTTAWPSLTIPDGSSGSVVLLNFSVIGAPGATSYMGISEIEFANTGNEPGIAPLWDGMFSVLHLGTISGAITFSCNKTVIAGAVVDLTKNGSLISSTITDTNGRYTFTDLEPGDYAVRVSKIHFWGNSTSVTTYSDPETVSDLGLLLRGDLNDNGKIADAEDVNMIMQAFNKDIYGDKYFDLNENGVIADFGDVDMMLQASTGDLIL